MEIWKNYFDIVILPPPPIRDQAIALSAEIARHGGKFVLGTREYLPHISIYHIAVRPENFPPFVEEVRRIAAAAKSGDLKLAGIEMPVLKTDKPAWLKKLHLEVVRNTCMYQDRDYGVEGLWKFDYLPEKLNRQARQNIEKFGSPLVGTVFRPHITLTSFEDKSRQESVPVPAVPSSSFHVDRISICELGPSHSCQRVVEEFQLNS